MSFDSPLVLVLFNARDCTAMTLRKIRFPRFVSLVGCLASIAIVAVCSGFTPNDLTRDDPRNQSLDVHLDPHKVVGYEACSKCHTAEIETWKKTPHFQTFLTLHRNPEAKKIAERLGIQSFKSDSRCIQCHYTMQHQGGSLEAISGISCESCHGAAKNWVNVHYDYGGANITRDQESPAHRLQRLRESISQGMRNPINVYLLAQSCYRCHTVPDEELVNVGGHKAGSLDFEIVSWSQGLVRHNFVRSNGQTNDPSSRDRLRQMFVAGLIADLEFSLRSTARATAKADFGITSAKRAKRAADRLRSAQEKISQPILDEALVVFDSIKLKINNRESLEEAAGKINKLGVKFAATVPGKDLEGIDGYIPSEDRWK
jgi:hypothetical protein